MNKLTPYEQSLAEQLSDLPVPSEDQAWLEMKKLLDEDDDDGIIVPPPPRRGCALLVILLLLILGACLYFFVPRGWFSNKNTEKEVTAPATARDTMSTTGAISDSTTETGISRSEEANPEDSRKQEDTRSSTDSKQKDPTTGGDADVTNGTVQTATARPMIRSAGKSNVNITPGTSGIDTSVGKTTVNTGDPYTNNNKSGNKERANSSVSRNGVPLNESTVTSKNRNSSRLKPAPRKSIVSTTRGSSKIGITSAVMEEPVTNSQDTEGRPLLNDTDSLLVKITSPVTDSVLKDEDGSKPVVKLSEPADTAKAAPKKKKFHFGVGIALNQGVPLNGEKVVAVDNYGRESALTDYIPSIYLRLYREKKWFIQSEFRYGAPQYIREFVYKQNIKQDSANAPRITTSYKLKKTYYHQFPLSFNYLILPNWSLGTGIIYNKFTGAISDEEIRRRLPGAINDSLLSFTVINDKKDSSFVKNSFQWLLETQYKWRRFSIGARYAQGLQAYINYTDPVTNLPVSKKNTSLHVFIRYEIWNSRKRMVGYRDKPKTKTGQ